MAAGTRPFVFCASLADVFDNQVDPEWRADLFELIRTTPQLVWLLLTKRPQNIVDMVKASGAIAGNGTRYVPGNCALGTTIEDQKRADINVPALLRAKCECGPAFVFVSCEPLLEAVDLRPWQPHLDNDPNDPRMVLAEKVVEGGIDLEQQTLDWVIAGGETDQGKHEARPTQADWFRALRDQCVAAGVPFHFKQWGEWTPGENVERTRGTCAGATWFDDRWIFEKVYLSDTDGHVDDEPDVYRVGKKAAGRLLDGVEHNGMPKISREETSHGV
jgi:protein gp37